MEWPYQSANRGRLPADEHALGAAEYNMLDRPYGLTPQMAAYKKVMAYSGNTFTRNWIADEKQHPLTGTPYAWVRARVLGGKTNLWGRVSLRFSEQDLKAKSFDGFGEDWPFGYGDIAPYYDLRRSPARHVGHEGEPAAAARRHLPARRQADLRRGDAEERHRQDGAAPDPGPRRRHHRGRRQQVPGPLRRPWPLRPRLRSAGADALADGADLPGPRHRQPHAAAELHGRRGAGRPEQRQGVRRPRHRQRDEGEPSTSPQRS